MLLFLTTLGILHYRVSPSRFVSIMTIALLFGGLAQTIQIVPCSMGTDGPADYHTQTVQSTSLGYLGTGILQFSGVLFVKFGRRGSLRKELVLMLAVSSALLGTTWSAMAELFGPMADYLPNIQIATMGLYLLTGVALKPELRPRVLRFLKLGLTGMLIPLTAGVLWIHLGVNSIYDEGFHISVLLWWMALLLPVLGLGVDFINVYYGKGMTGEKRFLRSVIDAIPHFIFARDTQGRFTLVNKAVADFYGLTTGKIEGRHLSEIHIDSEQCDQWLVEDQEILQDGHSSSIAETTTLDASGQTMWINAIKTPLTTRGSEQLQVLGISIDITRQKKAEIALANRLSFEQTATSALQQFIKCTVDNFDDNITHILETVARFANGKRCCIYRFEENSLAADLLYFWQKEQPGSDTPPPKRLATGDLSWLNKWFNLNKPYVAQYMSGLPDEAEGCSQAWGSSEDCALLLLPIHYQGSIFGFLGLDSSECNQWSNEEIVLLRNIVDLFITVWTKLETEKNLTRAMEEARASSLAKSEFLANMSHEIRTPMNCVIGISDLLMDLEPTPNQKQYLEMISQSGSSLLVLINDILDLSKIEAGQLELDLAETNLRDLVEEVAGLIAFNAQAKNLEMVCRYAPGAPDMVICDPNRLRQVLTNLLNNAVKFTNKGHIYLNVEPIGQKDQLLELQFQISDTGIGIPPDKLEKIFDKFTQADTTTTRRFGGTGLGLSISQQLVQLMNGQIQADSIEGSGATFTFTLSVEVIENSLQAPEHPTEPETGILVISSHELGCEVLAEQVRHLGYACNTALGCQQSLKRLDDKVQEGGRAWSHILVDQDVLPEDTHLIQDFLEKIPAETRPKLVLLTSLSSILREADLTSGGFSGTLTKPVRPSRLAEVLSGAQSLDRVSVPTVTSVDMSCPVTQEVSTLTEQEPQPDQPLVLLAEDNPFNQKVAQGMLKLLGCLVELANNGAEALAMVQEQPYDLIFMDCQMPEMDGYEATRMIRKLSGPQSETTIIAMTANALSGDRRACFTAGMDDFLSKPITKSMLSEMLAKWEILPAPVSS